MCAPELLEVPVSGLVGVVESGISKIHTSTLRETQKLMGEPLAREFIHSEGGSVIHRVAQKLMVRPLARESIVLSLIHI